MGISPHHCSPQRNLRSPASPRSGLLACEQSKASPGFCHWRTRCPHFGSLHRGPGVTSVLPFLSSKIALGEASKSLRRLSLTRLRKGGKPSPEPSFLVKSHRVEIESSGISLTISDGVPPVTLVPRQGPGSPNFPHRRTQGARYPEALPSVVEHLAAGAAMTDLPDAESRPRSSCSDSPALGSPQWHSPRRGTFARGPERDG